MPPGKLLILLGVVLVIAGLLASVGINFSWIGRLPGDIRIERENMRAYFPITTCLLISLVVSLLLWLFKR